MSKYYAVKNGFVPGIYTTWEECEAQVKGYKGARYKSFSNEEDARCFIGQSHVIQAEDVMAIKDTLNAIRTNTKERSIAGILENVQKIAEILNIELEEDNLLDYLPVK